MASVVKLLLSQKYTCICCSCVLRFNHCIVVFLHRSRSASSSTSRSRSRSPRHQPSPLRQPSPPLKRYRRSSRTSSETSSSSPSPKRASPPPIKRYRRPSLSSSNNSSNSDDDDGTRKSDTSSNPGSTHKWVDCVHDIDIQHLYNFMHIMQLHVGYYEETHKLIPV